MILLLQHHPGSSTSISSPSLQPLISPSFSLLQHPILRIIFNHLSPSHSFSFLSHTYTRQIRSSILYNNGICILFYNQVTLGSNHPPKTMFVILCIYYVPTTSKHKKTYTQITKLETLHFGIGYNTLTYTSHFIVSSG